MRNRKALVTGGAGFIGSHLCDRLVREGHDVVALDDLSTGCRANVAQLKSNDNFRLIVGDVTDRAATNTLVKDCDVIFHLAAAVGVRLVVDQPIRSMTTNIRGTETMLELACRWRKPILVASTSEVYGKASKVPFSEDDDLVLGPTRMARWSYACSKALDEFLALAYARDKGVAVIVARYFNTVGPRQSDQYGMVVPTFVRQALSGEPITVHGDGTQSRMFSHVTDTVDATCRLAADPAAAGRVYNIGGNVETTILALAKRVRERANSSSPISVVPYDKAFDARDFEDMHRRVPDLTRLDAQIGYCPSHSLDDIIDGVIAHVERQTMVV